MNYIMHGTASEKEEILALYKSQLGREFCPWTEFYPTEKEIGFDLSRDSLFVMKNKANCVIIYEIVGEGVYEKRNIR